MNIVITRPTKEDREEIQYLFKSAITKAFQNDGVGDRVEAIQGELEKQLGFLDQDFSTDGSDLYYLVAKTDNQIVGTIAYGKASDLTKRHANIDYKKVPEIKSVYVHPKFQGKGIGSQLFNELLNLLKQKHVEEIVLDGGYKKSQAFWMKKVGQPTVVLENYWGEGLHHMIWDVKLKDL